MLSGKRRKLQKLKEKGFGALYPIYCLQFDKAIPVIIKLP